MITQIRIYVSCQYQVKQHNTFRTTLIVEYMWSCDSRKEQSMFKFK